MHTEAELIQRINTNGISDEERASYHAEWQQRFAGKRDGRLGVQDKAQDTKVNYRASLGELVQLRSTLSALDFEAMYSGGTVVSNSVSTAEVAQDNIHLAEAINILYGTAFSYCKPISKSHAQRLCKALIALIDSRLPR